MQPDQQPFWLRGITEQSQGQYHTDLGPQSLKEITAGADPRRRVDGADQLVSRSVGAFAPDVNDCAKASTTASSSKGILQHLSHRNTSHSL